MSSQKYHIQSVDTKYYLISHNEKEGEIVFTQNGQHSVPANTILTISPPVTGPTIKVTISGVKGLYVAFPKDHKVGDKLIWSKEKFYWQAVLTPVPGGTTHQFIPADGENLYWFDKFGIGPVIIIEDGKHITPPESYFKLTKAA